MVETNSDSIPPERQEGMMYEAGLERLAALLEEFPITKLSEEIRERLSIDDELWSRMRNPSEQVRAVAYLEWRRRLSDPSFTETPGEEA